MTKRKPMDKAQVRERRDRLLASAAMAELSLTDGVREMRAISGMTQEEFARHRDVSARVIKALELGQGNPTVATLNRIGQFFGLEVAFVPAKRTQTGDAPAAPSALPTAITDNADGTAPRNVIDRRLANAIKVLHDQLALLDEMQKDMQAAADTSTLETPPVQTASNRNTKRRRSS